MSALIWLLPVAMVAALIFTAYGWGVENGYSRCWNEHHPRTPPAPTGEQ